MKRYGEFMGKETQFSIYKIDNDKIITDEVKKTFPDINIDNMLEYLIKDIKTCPWKTRH